MKQKRNQTAKLYLVLIILLFIALVGLTAAYISTKIPRVNIDTSLIMNDPLIVGHRGAMDYAPENTIRSFRLAKEQGADMLEMDLHLSKDGEIVIFHDYNISGFSDKDTLIKDMTLDEIKQVDIDGEEIPTLDEVFDEFGKNTLYLLEIKNEHAPSTGIEPVLAQKIQERDLYKHVLIESFNPLALMRLKSEDNEINVGLTIKSNLSIYLRETWFKNIADANFIVAKKDMIDEEFMQRYKNYWIFAWIVEEQQEAEHLKELGVKGFVVNAPDKFTNK